MIKMHHSDLEQEATRYRNLIPAGVSHIEMSRSMVGIICDFYYNGIKYMIDVTPYSESQDILAVLDKKTDKNEICCFSYDSNGYRNNRILYNAVGTDIELSVKGLFSHFNKVINAISNNCY